MYGWHDMAGWDWVWMTFMMAFWLAAIGAVVYFAVRLANDRSGSDGDRRRFDGAADREARDQR
jgi:hypothetical protein